MYCTFKMPCTTYYGNRCGRRTRHLHLRRIAAKRRLPLEALFERSLLGQRPIIGVQDVEHPWVEWLHHSQRVCWDGFIILSRSNRLIPANIGLDECMNMIRMHKTSSVPYTACCHLHLKLSINFRIASLPGLAEATPLIAHEVVPHVAPTSGFVTADSVQVVLVPDHDMLRQARDWRVAFGVCVPRMGVRLHLQLPP